MGQVSFSHEHSAKALAHAGGSPGAIHFGHVQAQHLLSVRAGGQCGRWEVRLAFGAPVLRVAKEIERSSCGFAAVLAHEKHHIRLYQHILEQFKADMMAVPIEVAGSERIEPLRQLAQQSLAQGLSLHREFDGADEYRRLTSTCGGELGRLTATLLDINH